MSRSIVLQSIINGDALISRDERGLSVPIRLKSTRSGEGFRSGPVSIGACSIPAWIPIDNTRIQATQSDAFPIEFPYLTNMTNPGLLKASAPSRKTSSRLTATPFTVTVQFAKFSVPVTPSNTSGSGWP